MACKDCIHYDVCGKPGILKERICHYFKHKSKFIELPCEIGETIYKIVTMRCENCKYDDTIQCSRRDRCPQTVERHSFSYEDIPWFGKKVFITCEEAKKALKEPEIN